MEVLKKVFVFCALSYQGTFIFSIVKYSPLKFSDSYTYPLWANILGWFVASSSLLIIPIFVLYQLAHGNGTLQQVSFHLKNLILLQLVAAAPVEVMVLLVEGRFFDMKCKHL